MINEWLKETRHKIIVMTAVIFLLGAAVGKNFLIDSDLRTLKDLLAQITEENRKEETLKRLLGLEEKIKNYDKFIAETSDASWLIETVNVLAKESGASLVSMAPQQVNVDEKLGKLILLVEARCSYHDLGKFVSRIESEPHFIKIFSLNANSQGRVGQQRADRKLNVTLSLVAYYLRQKALT